MTTLLNYLNDNAERAITKKNNVNLLYQNIEVNFPCI